MSDTDLRNFIVKEAAALGIPASTNGRRNGAKR